MSPDGANIDLRPSIELKIALLNELSALGQEILVVDSYEPVEAIGWILASFHSPVSVAPLNPALPESEKELLLQSLPAKKWVMASKLNGLTPTQRPRRAKDLEEVWAMIFTSGSTGKPKAVALSGSALRNSAFGHKERVSSSDRPWLLNLPIFHIGGFSILSRSFFLGTRIALPAGRPLDEIVRWITSGSVCGISLVPTILHRLVEKKISPHQELLTVLLGGAPCPDDLYERGVALGYPLRRTYGMTETSSQLATESQPRAGMALLPDMKVKISDSGEILVAGPNLALGYYADGVLIPLEILDGFFPTGDLGAFDGHVLTVTGRKSELIVSGGLNIHPFEIEAKLSTRNDLIDFAAFALPDREWGEKLCIAVVPRYPDHFKESEVLDYLKSFLDRRKVPKEVFRVSSIPRTPSGKVKRKDLSAFIQKNIPLE